MYFSPYANHFAAYYARMQMSHLHCNYRTICRARRHNKDTEEDLLGEIAFPPPREITDAPVPAQISN